MCLATVYKTVKDTEEVVLKNVSRIYVEVGSARLVDIMGAETVVEGSFPVRPYRRRSGRRTADGIHDFDR